MTLGRTDKNKIKIKVEDGTTTAVNCACCVTCECFPPAGRWRIEQVLYFGDPLNITARTDYNDYDPCGYFDAETAEGFSVAIYWECSTSEWRAGATVPPAYQGDCDGSDFMQGGATPEEFENDPSIEIAAGGYEFFCYGTIIASKEP